MKPMSTAEIRELEVINLCGGEKLGYPSELEIDTECAKVLALIVSGKGGIPFVSGKEEFRIPWCNIECIGEDAILVKIPKNELSAYIKQRKGFGKRK